MARRKKYWLLKTEPSTYSIDDLANEPDQTTHWDGIRNYQARNYIRDDMQEGDRVLLYHSNAKPPAVVGTATIVREAYPDFTAFDPNSKYFDPKSRQDEPRWFMVDVRLDDVFDSPVSLDDIKKTRSLKDMVLVNNSRLSVQPVTKKEFDTVVKMGSRVRS